VDQGSRPVEPASHQVALPGHDHDRPSSRSRQRALERALPGLETDLRVSLSPRVAGAGLKTAMLLGRAKSTQAVVEGIKSAYLDSALRVFSNRIPMMKPLLHER
jgi:hypothetical protein